MMAAFIKHNCEPRVDGNSPGKINSGKRFYADSNFSEIYSRDNISVHIAEKEIEQVKCENEADIEALAEKEVEQFNYEEEADIEVKVDITPPTNSNFSKINTRENTSVDVAGKESGQPNYKTEADIEALVEKETGTSYANSNFSGINTRENISVDIKESEQSINETKTDFEIETNIASSAEISSGEQFSTSNNFSKPTINIRKNIPLNIAEKESDQSNYKTKTDIGADADIEALIEKEMEQFKYEEEADIEVKIDITSSAEISSGKPICTSSKFNKPTVNTGKNISQNVDVKYNELKNSQNMQKESTKELKMLQEESSRKIQGLEENIKVLQKESSKEIQGLKENISEIMTFLKNGWKSPSVFSEIKKPV